MTYKQLIEYCSDAGVFGCDTCSYKKECGYFRDAVGYVPSLYGKIVGDLDVDKEIVNDEIIRCKDCRWHRTKTYKYITGSCKNTTVKYCDYFSTFCNEYETEDDDYCSWAERKDEEE